MSVEISEKLSGRVYKLHEGQRIFVLLTISPSHLVECLPLARATEFGCVNSACKRVYQPEEGGVMSLFHCISVFQNPEGFYKITSNISSKKNFLYQISPFLPNDFQHMFTIPQSNLVCRRSFESTERGFCAFQCQEIKTKDLEIVSKSSRADVNFIVFMYSAQNIVLAGRKQTNKKSQMQIKINDSNWVLLK